MHETKENNQQNETARQLFVSRTVNAPVELVWKVWTEADHIKNWWGPVGFTNTIFKMDLRPGGEWDFVMHGPDGTDYRNKSIFREIVPLKKIVFDHVSGPLFQSVIEFSDEGDKTTVSVTMTFPTAEIKEQTIKVFKADEGLKQNIDKLEAYLKNI